MKRYSLHTNQIWRHHWFPDDVTNAFLWFNRIIWYGKWSDHKKQQAPLIHFGTKVVPDQSSDDVIETTFMTPITMPAWWENGYPDWYKDLNREAALKAERKHQMKLKFCKTRSDRKKRPELCKDWLCCIFCKYKVHFSSIKCFKYILPILIYHQVLLYYFCCNLSKNLMVIWESYFELSIWPLKSILH